MEWSDEGKRGTRPRAPRDRRFQSAYLFGAVCPQRKTGAAIVMAEVGIEAMNVHLTATSETVGVGAIAVLVLDQAGWHTSERLKLPRPSSMAKLQSHRRCLLRSLEQAHADAGTDRLPHPALLGSSSGHRIGPLVLCLLPASLTAGSQFFCQPPFGATLVQRRAGEQY
jgi:hypothetical protein